MGSAAKLIDRPTLSPSCLPVLSASLSSRLCVRFCREALADIVHNVTPTMRSLLFRALLATRAAATGRGAGRGRAIEGIGLVAEEEARQLRAAGRGGGHGGAAEAGVLAPSVWGLGEGLWEDDSEWAFFGVCLDGATGVRTEECLLHTLCKF